MRPDKFPKVNDVMLAEALRQLIPVAEFGVRSLKTDNAVMPFRRAEMILDMWARQDRQRKKQLGGPLPPMTRFSFTFFQDAKNPDPGQTVPSECERPRRKQRDKRKDAPAHQ
jgi:hypothetical protein